MRQTAKQHNDDEQKNVDGERKANSIKDEDRQAKKNARKKKKLGFQKFQFNIRTMQVSCAVDEQLQFCVDAFLFSCSRSISGLFV